MHPDLVYYRQRFVDEMIAVRRAACPQAAARHRELADLYLRKWGKPKGEEGQYAEGRIKSVSSSIMAAGLDF